jgi:hypothetical protein
MTTAERHKRWQGHATHVMVERVCVHFLPVFLRGQKEEIIPPLRYCGLCFSAHEAELCLTFPFLAVPRFVKDMWEMREYPGATFRFREQMSQVANTACKKAASTAPFSRRYLCVKFIKNRNIARLFSIETVTLLCEAKCTL